MPIYEYACPDCGHKFDEIQKFSDAPITVCPKCAAANVKKLISQTSFILKGGGWYKDHYGLKPGGDGDKGGKSEAAKGDSGKSEGAKSEGGKSESSKSEGSATPSAPAASAPAPSSSPSSGSTGST